MSSEKGVSMDINEVVMAIFAIHLFVAVAAKFDFQFASAFDEVPFNA